VENESTSHNSVGLVVRVSEISKFAGNLMKFWQKQVGTFFGPPCTARKKEFLIV